MAKSPDLYNFTETIVFSKRLAELASFETLAAISWIQRSLTGRNQTPIDFSGSPSPFGRRGLGGEGPKDGDKSTLLMCPEPAKRATEVQFFRALAKKY
ncbi:MAG: hypothetical protein ABIP75_06515 [Pyrinomonadaceae bacterium]